jgi:hypothetical protein
MVFFARSEIRGVHSMKIIAEWPFGVGNAKPQFTTRLKDAEAFAEQATDFTWVIEMLEAVFRKNQFATPRFERKVPTKVNGYITSGDHVDVQEAFF